MLAAELTPLASHTTFKRDESADEAYGLRPISGEETRNVSKLHAQSGTPFVVGGEAPRTHTAARLIEDADAGIMDYTLRRREWEDRAVLYEIVIYIRGTEYSVVLTGTYSSPHHTASWRSEEKHYDDEDGFGVADDIDE